VTTQAVEEQRVESEPLDRVERSIWERIPRVLSVGGFVCLLLLLWQVVVWLELTSELILPPPVDVLDEVGDLLGNMVRGGYVLDNTWITVKEIVLGFLLAALAGIGLGVLVGETAFGRIVLMPFLVGVNAAPKVAFAPIFVAWFGFGIGSKVAMGAFIAFFPLLIDTAAGLAITNADQLKLFRSVRATRRQTFVKLKLPSALPFVFAGLKTAAVLAVVGAIVGEFLGGGTGLGAQIRISSSRFAMDRVFGYVVVLSVMAYFLFAVVTLVEHRVVFWRKTGFVPDAVEI
jgi:NitT/TauT family transport system permease protein